MQISDHLKNILVQHNQPTTDYSVTDDFINWVMRCQEIFKKIIPQLPTRKIAGSETLLNRTLFTQVVLARFLIKHMIIHGELDAAEKARISILFKGVKQEANLSDVQRKAVCKINRMLGRIPFESQGFNFTVFYEACLSNKGEKQCPLECLLAGVITSSQQLISFALESKTKEELDAILNFRNLVLPIQIPVHPLSLVVTVNPYEILLDFVPKLPCSTEKLYLLIQIMRSKGLEDVVDDWLVKNPQDKLLVEIEEFSRIAKKIKTEEGDALPEISPKLRAKHTKNTKKDRLVLRRMLTAFGQLATNQDSVTIADFNKSLTFSLESGLYHALFMYGCAVPSYLQQNGKTVALKYPLSEIFSWNHLFTLFHGHELEVSFHYTSDEWLAKDFWDNWERLNHSPVYSTTVYPAFTLAMDQIRPKLNATPLFLDVCGGKGLLARRILDQHKVSYLLLEYNEPSIREARNRLGTEAVVVNTDVVNDPEWFSDQDKTLPLKSQVVDVTIASGALAHTVLKSKDEALVVLKKIHNYLKSGGYLLLSGQTDSYINAEDFRANGFAVLNASLPVRQHFFYIVQKR